MRIFFGILFAIVAGLFLMNCLIPAVRKKIYNSVYFFSNFIFSDVKINSRVIRHGLAKITTNVAGVVALIFFLSMFFSVALPYALSEEENKFTGPLGDLFNGIVTPILTFLTFLGLLITILIQQASMRASLKELELTRDEFIKSNEALQVQIDNSKAQKFDNNFYSLLEHHNKVIRDFCDMRKQVSVEISGRRQDVLMEMDIFYFKEFAEKSFDEAQWDILKDTMLPIFLINYQLLKFIDDHEKVLGLEDAKRYSNIVRSLIPNRILYLLLLNSNSYMKYRKIFEKYEFFEHLSFAGVSANNFVWAAKNYSMTAFGDKKRIKRYLENKYNIDIMGFSYVAQCHYKKACDAINSNNLIEDASRIISDLKDRYNRIYHLIDDFFYKEINVNSIMESNCSFKAYLSKDGDYFLTSSANPLIEYIEYKKECEKYFGEDSFSKD